MSAQRWERQFRMEFEKNDRLEDEIAAVRTQCTMLQDEGRVQMIFSILM